MPDTINVRCCCQPQKVLGTLPRSPDARPGTGARLAMMCQFVPPDLRTDQGTARLAPKQFFLPYAEFGPQRELAIKAESITLEELRLLPGFKPATTS